MLKNMVASALFAGVCAGLIAALLQFWLVQPVLLHAEEYESGALVHFGGVTAEADHDHSSHDHGDGAAEDEGEDPSPLVRNGLSVLFSMLVYAGYGLVLVAAMALANRQGVAVDARKGILWGIAGYVAAQLSPAMGLAPELPGSAAADVLPRQVWWFSTAVVTAAGLWLLAFGKGWAQWGLGVLLIAMPHIIGAPQPEALAGVAPPELAGEFAARALGTGLAAWAVLGAAAGYFWPRQQA